MKPKNIFMTTGEITKTGTLVTTFCKPVGGANPYVQFRYASRPTENLITHPKESLIIIIIIIIVSIT